MQSSSFPNLEQVSLCEYLEDPGKFLRNVAVAFGMQSVKEHCHSTTNSDHEDDVTSNLLLA